MTYQQDKKNDSSPYNMRLCRVVAGDKNVELWNNKYLKKEIRDEHESNLILSKKILTKISPVITFRETRFYSDSY